ncbi:MAG: pentapeptide repeat-containing protein, partial [Nitrospiraceae bacterium]
VHPAMTVDALKLPEQDLTLLTNLQNTDLTGALLKGADLRGADLSTARGLTQEQVNEACVDEHTVLPQGLKKQEICTKAE